MTSSLRAAKSLFSRKTGSTIYAHLSHTNCESQGKNLGGDIISPRCESSFGGRGSIIYARHSNTGPKAKVILSLGAAKSLLGEEGSSIYAQPLRHRFSAPSCESLGKNSRGDIISPNCDIVVLRNRESSIYILKVKRRTLGGVIDSPSCKIVRRVKRK